MLARPAMSSVKGLVLMGRKSMPRSIGITPTHLLRC